MRSNSPASGRGAEVAPLGSSPRAGALARLSPSEALARETQMLDRVARREEDVEILVWSTTARLVAPRALARLPGFEAGRASVEARGLPLVLRETGGDLMPQGPNVLNVTVAFAAPTGAAFGVAAAYDWLCGPLLDLIRARGVAAHCASVPGAFCDGRFDIAVGTRKLAGTAQRWRTRTRVAGTNEPGYAVLAHAGLFLTGDFRSAVDAANALYSACGLDRHVRAEAHVALAELAAFAADFHNSDPPEALATVILACYERAFNAIRHASGPRRQPQGRGGRRGCARQRTNTLQVDGGVAPAEARLWRCSPVASTTTDRRKPSFPGRAGRRISSAKRSPAPCAAHAATRISAMSIAP
jgi:hypothetical protein